MYENNNNQNNNNHGFNHSRDIEKVASNNEVKIEKKKTGRKNKELETALKLEAFMKAEEEKQKKLNEAKAEKIKAFKEQIAAEQEANNKKVGEAFRKLHSKKGSISLEDCMSILEESFGERD